LLRMRPDSNFDERGNVDCRVEGLNVSFKLCQIPLAVPGQAKPSLTAHNPASLGSFATDHQQSEALPPTLKHDVPLRVKHPRHMARRDTRDCVVELRSELNTTFILAPTGAPQHIRVYRVRVLTCRFYTHLLRRLASHALYCRTMSQHTD